jgi:SAM-dependent methyltransferase
MPVSRWSTGSGPGPIAPDGCAVDFYTLMTDQGEARIVHEAAGPTASILELGSGAGRVTHPLIALGHAVVAVDESPEMLARVTEAETVCSSIQDLSLGRRFDVVLLASHLINHPEDDARGALLATCREHVRDGGCVIVQQHPAAWFETVSDQEQELDGIIVRLRDVARPAPGILSGTVEYVAGDRQWTQTFTARQLPEAELDASLAAADLRLDRYLTADQSWFRAVPAGTAR